MKNIGWGLLVVNALLGTACGALKNDVGSGSGGSGGSKGDGATPMPPAGRAAVSLRLGRVDPADPIHGASECSPGEHWVNIPFQRDRPTADQTQQTTESDAPLVAVSGQFGDRVSCRVAPKGTAFEVTAEVTGYAEVNGQKLSPTVTRFAVTISADQPDALGRISIEDDASHKEFADDGCRFSTRGGALGVDGGRVWANVQCDYMEPRTSPNEACRIDSGYFLLENCLQ